MISPARKLTSARPPLRTAAGAGGQCRVCVSGHDPYQTTHQTTDKTQ